MNAPLKTDPQTGYVWGQPAWHDRIDPSARMVFISSGRGGGGKSIYMGWRMLAHACKHPGTLIVAAREVLKDLSESSQHIFKKWIRHPAAPWDEGFFAIRGSKILLANGSQILFRGLSSSSGTSTRIKSMEGIDILWCDEAESLTQETLDSVIPTIRKPNSKLFFTYNPHLPTDAVSQLASRAHGDPTIQHIALTYKDNPWWTDKLEEDRLRTLRDEPEKYAWMWEGQFSGADPYGLIPFHEVMACYKAWDEAEIADACDTYSDAGYDIAVSEKGDKNGYCVRRGGLLAVLEQWSGMSFRASCEKIRTLTPEDCDTLYYDAGGVGGGFGDDFADDDQWPAKLRPVNFGGAVKGKEVSFMRTIKNQEYFARRSSQLYWAVRMRVKNTLRYLAGEEVDIRHCLLLDSGHIDQRTAETFASQCSQAVYEHSKAGKLEVTKAPKGQPSPDLLDAAALAFTYDSVHGLREQMRRPVRHSALDLRWG